jgi:prefoldin subunit 5
MEAEAIEYLNQNYNDIESLEGLDQAIRDLDAEIWCVDTEIKDVVR